jgi:hypothetical protein
MSGVREIRQVQRDSAPLRLLFILLPLLLFHLEDWRGSRGNDSRTRLLGGACLIDPDANILIIVQSCGGRHHNYLWRHGSLSSSDRGAPHRGGAALEAENVIYHDNTIIGVGGTSLSSLAHASETKVVQLPTKGSKGAVVEVSWQNGGFHFETIMNDNAAQNGLAIRDRARIESNDIFILFEHIHQPSGTVKIKRKERCE